MGQGAVAESVLIVDDDPGFSEFLSELLGGAGYGVARARTGEEALEICEHARPWLVLLDVRLPGICGYEVCRELRMRPGAKPMILFLSGERIESCDRVAGLIIGGDDYLTKPMATDELLARIRSLSRRSPPDEGGLVSVLTPREREVLALLAEAKSPREVAAELVISPKTVATHIEHILEKLDVHSRAEAVAVAYREHLVGR